MYIIGYYSAPIARNYVIIAVNRFGIFIYISKLSFNALS